MEDMSSILVVKRDGSSEGFARTKIYNGVYNSGASQDVAEGVTLLVECWAKEVAGVEGQLVSSDIRRKVIEMLKLIDPKAAEKYESFKRSV